jgi:protein-S-isoprenylcysteine O-methyltransferase Ste14
MHMTASDRGPGAPLPPTLVFAGTFTAGWMLDRFSPIPLRAGDVSSLQVGIGLALLAIGVAIFFWGLVTFATERTGIMLQEPARRLVTAGPYRFSRNPQYIGFTAGYLGLACLANIAWPILLRPVAVAATAAGVIAREERYLRTTFGTRYDEYCRQVGRWL